MSLKSRVKQLLKKNKPPIQMKVVRLVELHSVKCLDDSVIVDLYNVVVDDTTYTQDEFKEYKDHAVSNNIQLIYIRPKDHTYLGLI